MRAGQNRTLLRAATNSPPRQKSKQEQCKLHVNKHADEMLPCTELTVCSVSKGFLFSIVEQVLPNVSCHTEQVNGLLRSSEMASLRISVGFQANKCHHEAEWILR